MLPELLDHDRTLERIEVWVCPRCGYWRQKKETGVHVSFDATSRGERHELRSEALPSRTEQGLMASTSTSTLRERIAKELAANDACGTGPLSEAEYRDDADAILRLVRDALLDWRTISGKHAADFIAREFGEG